jgi:septum formation protein
MTQTEFPSSGPEPVAVVLASASSSRKALLTSAGVGFETRPAHIDEDEIKRSLQGEGMNAGNGATMLAEMKAQRISAVAPGALVIGADQILVCSGKWFDKPTDMDEARDHLRVLRGRSHELATSAVIVRDGRRIWHHAEKPKLTMRPFTDSFIDDYLARAGDGILSSVGAYHLEGLGAQLFSRIDGDYFSILGMPLLPLLAILREHGVVGT